MPQADTAAIEAFLEVMAPRPDEVQEGMARQADAEGFPIVGRQVGGVLFQLALLTAATRIFEFGSGFGYSAYWFARALPDDGLVVLTEEDEAELHAAKGYLEAGGYADRAAFELGDAMETIGRYDGPFDVVLIDHAKEQYAAALEAIRPKLRPGGVVVADNAISAGPMDTEGLLRSVTEARSDPDLETMADGIYRYLTTLKEDSGLVTTVLPIGSGIAVSVRRRD